MPYTLYANIFVNFSAKFFFNKKKRSGKGDEEKDGVQGTRRSQIPQQPDGCEDFDETSNEADRFLGAPSITLRTLY